MTSSEEAAGEGDGDDDEDGGEAADTAGVVSEADR